MANVDSATQPVSNWPRMSWQASSLIPDAISGLILFKAYLNISLKQAIFF